MTYVFIIKSAKTGCLECELETDYPVIIEANTDEIAIRAAFDEFYKKRMMQHEYGFESIELYRVDKNLTSALNEEKKKRGIVDDNRPDNRWESTTIPQKEKYIPKDIPIVPF